MIIILVLRNDTFSQYGSELKSRQTGRTHSTQINLLNNKIYKMFIIP